MNIPIPTYMGAISGLDRTFTAASPARLVINQIILTYSDRWIALEYSFFFVNLESNI
jgi:hypothetical protein